MENKQRKWGKIHKHNIFVTTLKLLTIEGVFSNISATLHRAHCNLNNNGVKSKQSSLQIKKDTTSRKCQLNPIFWPTIICLTIQIDGEVGIVTPRIRCIIGAISNVKNRPVIKRLFRMFFEIGFHRRRRRGCVCFSSGGFSRAPPRKGRRGSLRDFGGQRRIF